LPKSLVPLRPFAWGPVTVDGAGLRDRCGRGDDPGGQPPGGRRRGCPPEMPKAGALLHRPGQDSPAGRRRSAASSGPSGLAHRVTEKSPRLNGPRILGVGRSFGAGGLTANLPVGPAWNGSRPAHDRTHPGSGRHPPRGRASEQQLARARNAVTRRSRPFDRGAISSAVGRRGRPPPGGRMPLISGGPGASTAC